MAQKKWYIVHVYSGFENKVKKALEDRIASSPHPDTKQLRSRGPESPGDEAPRLLAGERSWEMQDDASHGPLDPDG